MSAARRPSSTARRTLLTATAAGTLLAALWFVPSANAAQDGSGQRPLTATQAAVGTTADRDTVADAASSGSLNPTEAGARLADTGSVDTRPYVVGGTLFLCLGAGFVVYSVRRERATLSWP